MTKESLKDKITKEIDRIRITKTDITTTSWKKIMLETTTIIKYRVIIATLAMDRMKMQTTDNATITIIATIRMTTKIAGIIIMIKGIITTRRENSTQN